MINFEQLENIFFSVLADLRQYLKDLILVGGWVPYIYLRFLWKSDSIEPVTTSDIDFGFVGEPANYTKTIFDTLSSGDYTERHYDYGKIYPVIFYK